MSALKQLSIAVAVVMLGTYASAATIQIQYGNDNESISTANWSVVGSAGGTISNLVDASGAATGISLAAPNFQGVNGNGTMTPTPPASTYFPNQVTRDSVYGSDTYPTYTLTFSGLDANTTYTFTIFASRTSAGGSNRETEYFFAGGTSNTVYLDAAENLSDIAITGQLQPDGSQEITLTMSKGPNNDQSSGYFYLGGMVIETAPIPEPATLGLLGLGALALIRRLRV
jgi:hypothetical protein